MHVSSSLMIGGYDTRRNTTCRIISHQMRDERLGKEWTRSERKRGHRTDTERFACLVTIVHIRGRVALWRLRYLKVECSLSRVTSKQEQ